MRVPDCLELWMEGKGLRNYARADVENQDTVKALEVEVGDLKAMAQREWRRWAL